MLCARHTDVSSAPPPAAAALSGFTAVSAVGEVAVAGGAEADIFSWSFGECGGSAGE